MKKLLFVVMMAACGGGGGGVSSSIVVSDLTPGEITEECQYLYDTYPQKSVSCNGGTATVGEKSVADCEDELDSSIADAPDCDATVGDAEDCLDYLYGNICSTTGSLPASCAALMTSQCEGSSSRKLVEKAIAARNNQ